MIFVNPDFDLNVNLGRMLILIDELSTNNKKQHVITMDRIVLYEYLLKNPIVLTRLLKFLNKKIGFNIKDYEIGSLISLYPNSTELYRFQSIRQLLQLLYSRNLIEFHKHDDGNLFVKISDRGEKVCSQITSEYFVRLREIAKAIVGLHNYSFTSLRNNLKSITHE